MEKASNRRFLLSSSFSLVVLTSLISLVYSCSKFAYAMDTLLPGEILNSNQSLVSKNGLFRLGVDCTIPQEDFDSFCGLGIWFANLSYCKSDYFSIWRPNMDGGYLSFSSYRLSVSKEGVLYINSSSEYPSYDYNNWASPSMNTTSISAIAVLLDNGNLVIRDKANSSMMIWQSFDSPGPTNILLSGGFLGFDMITGENVTLVNSFYSVGFGLLTSTLALDSSRRRGFVIQQSNGLMFAGTFPGWMDIHEDGDYRLTFNDPHTYILLDRSGIVRFATQGECDSFLWSAPESLCDLDSYCGPYGLCKRSGSCMCPAGFDPPSTEAWNAAGCSRREPVSCGNNVRHPEVTFYPIDGIYSYPDYALTREFTNINECESSCLIDCSCTAFAYNTSCLTWYGELWNTIVFDSDPNGHRMYILMSTKQPSGSTTVPLLYLRKKVMFESMIGVLALIVIGLILLWRCRRKIFRARTACDNGSLMVFSFVQIKNSTKKFSEKLGEGGFGCVFKGTLPDCTVVAIKKLKGLTQGEKQFRAEVQTIGLIQHMNIVRLLGFCVEDSVQFLVYEYLENGSLNNHLFSKTSSKLGWEVRYSIAIGIARGLAYLHEECKDCIVHFDMKPDNILLDEQFRPKIADFGMAKLLGRDFSRVLTTMRGTIGYLAPEWISGLPVTHKADVYSYGMMLFEIISGRRNWEKIKEGKFTYFPIYAAVKVNEGGDVMCLLDGSLEGNADAEQLNRACRVACWCIQDDEDPRPMMGQVVHMLEGVLDVQTPPVPRSLQNYVGMEDSTSAYMGSFMKVSC